ncbi:MAG: LysR family transcriptional regulator [Sulfobacillus benefaciens]|uniref:LysR family transcriptional regulator n=1 Tax=Sulfobacillus benefaciens TaxID=453960 RepID=A0A2T2XKQ5_9FIRM|nr:MAG: LysR family transcriptional regulator [Sulfobacillus benefaciens]
MIEIRLLKYVVAVNETKNFSRAAELLRIAQPSLSQQIAKLERELGLRLFFRTHSGITPTPEGMAFIEKAVRIIRLDEDLEREMKEHSQGIGQELSIGTTAITGGHVLPPLLQVFGKQFPRVRIRLVEASSEQLEDLTTKGEVDFSILSLPLKQPQLTYVPLLTEPLLLALPKKEQEWMSNIVLHWLSSNTELVDLAQVSHMPFVLLKEGFGFRETVLQICAENGFQPHIAFETSSIETAQALVAHGLGITVIPKMVAHHDEGSPRYIAIQSAPTRTLVFAYSKERYLCLTAQKFLETFSDKQGLKTTT